MPPFGSKLQQARKISKISQEKLAELLDVAPRTIQYWEAGSYEPSIEMIKKIVKILQCDIRFLFDIEMDFCKCI